MGLPPWDLEGHAKLIRGHLSGVRAAKGFLWRKQHRVPPFEDRERWGTLSRYASGRNKRWVNPPVVYFHFLSGRCSGSYWSSSVPYIRTNKQVRGISLRRCPTESVNSIAGVDQVLY